MFKKPSRNTTANSSLICPFHTSLDSVSSICSEHYNIRNENHKAEHMEEEENEYQVTKEDSQLTNVARIVEACKLTGAEVLSQ